ncbi:PepSY-associated TM helix domain-containing protein [Mucilaginibacter calamicampi]|uniref:PepSY-associated TM helix domain-containing protein n=1 Tax=Mucilaginibacter calamicampi TaxID=1302352 RepID=A0ABW2YTF2_9SPHI
MLSTEPRSSAKKKSTFRRVSEWLHLWLGLFSGIIVFVVCLTGGIWATRYEVWYFTEPYQRVEVQHKEYLKPSELVALSRKYLKAKHENADTLESVVIGKPGKSAICTFDLGGGRDAAIYLNPYTGYVVYDKRERSAADDFFIFVRAGHRFFWLPQKIGSPVVGSACIIFIITLITGIIWWFPVKWNRKAREKAFKVKWSANWKRLNIDLHNVFGFYAMLFVLAMTVTGVVFTFEWFEKGIYTSLTWKKMEEPKQPQPFSDTTLVGSIQHVNDEDFIWNHAIARHPDFAKVTILFPANTKAAYQSFVQFGDGTLNYNRAIYYFDRYTLKPLAPTNPSALPYAEASLGEKVFRMNFDIHTGQILGLPTKILAEFACLIGASLPVTGFIIWYNRKWGKKKTRRKKRAKGDAAPQLV